MSAEWWFGFQIGAAFGAAVGGACGAAVFFVIYKTLNSVGPFK